MNKEAERNNTGRMSEEASFGRDAAVFRRLLRHELLTAEQERALLEQVALGQEAREQGKTQLEQKLERAKRAREQLVMHNQRFVARVAIEYIGKGLPFPDLFQIGNLGLMIAIEKFELKKKTRLSTYAAWWIKGEIERALDNQGEVIRKSVHAHKLLRNITAFQEHFRQNTKREPTWKEVVKKFDISLERLLAILAGQPISLDEITREGTNAGSLIVDENSPDPQEEMLRRLLYETLESFFVILTSKERNVLCLFFGWNGRGPYTLNEIGAELGFSRETARLAKKSALEKLLPLCQAQKLQAFLMDRMV